MIYRGITAVCITILGFWACTPQDEIIINEAVSLQFSTDTVFFDTLFTNELSVTKRFRVYNPQNKAVIIDRLNLQEGASSPYTLKINGREAKDFSQIQLFGKDSLLVLVEAILPRTEDIAPYLASDFITVENKGLVQKVPVVGYGQNANVLGGIVLDCNTTWSTSLPYVIEESVLVEENCLLTIEAGARIYFKPGAYLLVEGTLLAEGDSALTDQIIFRNFRLDPAFDQPAQWGGLYFRPGSLGNRLRYCQIRNAITGIQLGEPLKEGTRAELSLENCRLINHFTAGILAFGSELEATNTLVANCLGPGVATLAGGNYSFIHCTFANYFRGSVSRELPTAFFSDIFQGQDIDTGEPLSLVSNLNLTMLNSIVWGNLFEEEEWTLDGSGGQQITLQVERNLIRTTADYLTPTNLTSLDRDFPQFIAPAELNFMPDTTSPARNAGLDLGIPKDLYGAERDAQPDIGAIEYRELPEEEDQ